MTYQRLNPPFDIPLSELEEKLEIVIGCDFSGFERIIPLREIKHTSEITLFKNNVFQSLLRKIPLRSNNGEKRTYPYEHAKIQVYAREPKGLMIGQTFVVRSTLLLMMEELSTTSKKGIFRDYPTNGFSNMPPLKVYGLDSSGNKAMAFYIPPIVEIQGNYAVLLDGIHRNYICATAGTTLNAVHLSSTNNFTIPPLPFDVSSWHDIEILDNRPPVEKRYKNLRREYFRDLSSVGIDG